MNMRVSRKFCQRWSVPTLSEVFCFFQLMGCREDRNVTISGPSSAHQRNTIEMGFRCHANNGPPLNAGLVAL